MEFVSYVFLMFEVMFLGLSYIISGFIADVRTGVACKFNCDGSVGKSRWRQLQMEFVRILREGGVEAEGKPRSCERSKLQVEDGGCGGADSSHTG